MTANAIHGMKQPNLGFYRMKIDLTTQQWNYILNVLGQRPYVEVVELIAEIQKQAVDDQTPKE